MLMKLVLQMYNLDFQKKKKKLLTQLNPDVCFLT